MRNTKRLLLIFLLAIGQISLTFSAETTTSDSPCFLQAPLNFKATHTGPNFVFLTWTPTAPGETYRIRLYRATDNQLYSTVDVQGSIGFKLLFMPSNKIHYAVIRGVCANGYESGYLATSNIFSAHGLDLLAIGYAPAPTNIACTISHGSQGCVISTTDISDFALLDESSEEVLKTFNVRQESSKKHYQVLDGSTSAGNSGYSIKLDNQSPDYYDGIEYSIVANKNGSIIASFQVFTHYNPDFSELYVTSLADGFDIVKYESMGLHGGTPSDQRNTNLANPQFEVSPNPFLNTISIQLNDPSASIKSLLLMNLQGQTVKAEMIPEDFDQYHLDVADLPAGIYFLRLESAGQILTQKLIKSN